MMTEEFRCAWCGKHVKMPAGRIYRLKNGMQKRVFCDSRCNASAPRSKPADCYSTIWRAWRAFSRMEGGFSVHVTKGRNDISRCYLNEARAMLAGKNTAGKNKCVKLPGDEA
jgi:hypothetical protein